MTTTQITLDAAKAIAWAAAHGFTPNEDGDTIHVVPCEECGAKAALQFSPTDGRPSPCAYFEACMSCGHRAYD